MARGGGGSNAIRKSCDEGVLVGRLVVTVHGVGRIQLRHGGGKQRADQQQIGLHRLVVPVFGYFHGPEFTHFFRSQGSYKVQM